VGIPSIAVDAVMLASPVYIGTPPEREKPDI